MASIEEIRRISIIASTQGVDAAKMSLDQLAQAQTKVASSASGMASSTNSVGGSALSASARVETLRRAHDAAYASQRKLEAGQRTVATAFNQGGISAEMAAGTLLALQKRYGGVTTAAHAAASAHATHAASMGNSRMAAMELEHSVRAVADALAAGANPLRVFSMEFGRLSEAASMSGGFGNMLRGAGSIFAPMLRPLLSPLGIMGGLGLGAGALGLVGYNSYQSRLLAEQMSLNGLGRSTGLTPGGLNSLALGAAGGHTTTFQAQDAFAALAATGRISPDMMRQLVAPLGGQSEGLIQQFSRATGTGFGEATKTLAADFADPTKGAEALNKQFGFLDGAQMELITHLDAGGQRLQAQGVLLEDLRNRIQGAADVTSIWARAWDLVASGASNAVAAAGRYVSPMTPEDELAKIRANSQLSRGYLSRPVDPFDAARAKTLQQVIALNDYAAYQKGVDQIAIEKSLDINEITRRTIPDIGARQTLLDQRDKLQAAMNTPGALQRAGVTPDQAQEAINRANNGLSYLSTAAEKVAQDSMLAAQAIQASTAQERVAIEAQKAWLDTMRSSHDATEAAASALGKWNEAIAQTNKQAEDALRSATDRAGMIGLSPLQRDLRENDIRFRDYRKDSVFAPSASLPAGATGYTAQLVGTNPSLDLMKSNIADSLAKGQPDYARTAAEHYVLGAAMAPQPFGSYGPQMPASVVAAGHVGGYAAPMASSALTSTAAGNFSSAQSISAGAIIDEHTSEVMRLANVELQKQQGLLDANAGAWAKSTDQLNKAIAVQEAWNRLGLTDVDKATLDPTRMASLAASVNQSADTTVSQQAQQRQQQQQLDQINSLNDMARSFTSGSLGDIANEFSNSTSRQDILSQLDRGQQDAFYTGRISLNQARMEAAQRQISGLASRSLINYGIGTITKGIFGSGQVGSSGYQPGLVGGLVSGLGSMFGGGGGATASGLSDFDLGDELAGSFGGFGAGGIVGGVAPQRYRASLSAFAGAPHFDTGGVVGAVPIIAHKGEGVFTAAQMKAMGGAGGTTHNYQFAGSTVVVQGNADEKTIPLIQAAIAQNNATQAKVLQRTITQVQSKNSLLYS